MNLFLGTSSYLGVFPGVFPCFSSMFAPIKPQRVTSWTKVEISAVLLISVFVVSPLSLLAGCSHH